MSIATLAWIAPSTTNTGGKTSKNKMPSRKVMIGTALLSISRTNKAILHWYNETEDKGEAMIGTALLSISRTNKAKPITHSKMLSRKVMIGTALSSISRTNKAILHKYKKGTRRTERATIPRGCRIANLQRPKRDSIMNNTNKNTQESKCTFQSTKQTRPRRGQRPPTKFGKDKKHIQTFIGAITTKDNIWTLPVTVYARNAHGRAKTPYREEGRRQQLLTKSIQ
jgi:hypothetical protein